MKPPAPRVKSKEEILPEPNINERVRSGEATLKEKPELVMAHQTIAKRIGGSQPHDPNAIQMPDGSYATIVQREDGTKMALPVKKDQNVALDNDMEQAVNEITTQELKVTTLAIMKKVAMSPSTVMGFASCR